MPKVISKLFRDPRLAGKAAEELQAHGFKVDEIGILTLNEEGVKRLAGNGGHPKARVDLPALGPTTAVGALGKLLANAGEPKAALIQALEISDEAYSYYERGLSLGGVVISVHANGQRLSQAKDILRKVEDSTREKSQAPWRHSPGFTKAMRMTQTDALDEKMSGDFRRY